MWAQVDYAIMRDGAPAMIFECKRQGSDLSSEATSRFGVLTDGVTYLFFSDLSEQNKMDTKPFLEIDLLDFTEA